jgi:hypothetical protein
VICVLVTNEDDFTFHFDNAMLPDKNNPAHGSLFTRGYKAFAKENGLVESKVFSIRLAGPGKLYMNDVEHKFNETMIQSLRALGPKAPIATTNFWGREALSSLPASTDGDVIEIHSYGASEAMSSNPSYDANFLP